MHRYVIRMERFGTLFCNGKPKWYHVQGVRCANTEYLALRAAKEMWHDSRDFEIVGIETNEGIYKRV